MAEDVLLSRNVLVLLDRKQLALDIAYVLLDRHPDFFSITRLLRNHGDAAQPFSRNASADCRYQIVADTVSLLIYSHHAYLCITM